MRVAVCSWIWPRGRSARPLSHSAVPTVQPGSILICTQMYEKSVKANTAKLVSLRPGKGAEWLAEFYTMKVKNQFHPTHLPSGSKNVILCFLANMRWFIRDGIFTGDQSGYTAQVHSTHPCILYSHDFLKKESINQLTCMNSEIKGG